VIKINVKTIIDIKNEKKCKKVLTSVFEFGILIWQSKNCATNITKIKFLTKKVLTLIFNFVIFESCLLKGEKN